MKKIAIIIVIAMSLLLLFSCAKNKKGSMDMPGVTIEKKQGEKLNVADDNKETDDKSEENPEELAEDMTKTDVGSNGSGSNNSNDNGSNGSSGNSGNNGNTGNNGNSENDGSESDICTSTIRDAG